MNKDDYIRELDNITAPEELKAKIKSAQQTKKKSSVPKHIRIIAVAACMVVVAVAAINLIPGISGVSTYGSSSLFDSKGEEAVAEDNGAYYDSSASGSTSQTNVVDITGAVAATAEPPQIEEPTPTSTEIFDGICSIL